MRMEISTCRILFFFDTARMFYQFNNDKDKTLSSRASFDFKNTFLNQPVRLVPDKDWVSRLMTDSIARPQTRVIAQKILDGEKRVQTLATVEVRAQQKSKKEKMEAEYT